MRHVPRVEVKSLPSRLVAQDDEQHKDEENNHRSPSDTKDPLRLTKIPLMQLLLHACSIISLVMARVWIIIAPLPSPPRVGLP